MRLDIRALGIAGGCAASASVLCGTLLLVAGGVEPRPGVLSRLLFGYTLSVSGAFVGALWAYVYGFAVAVLLGFVYNLAVVPRVPRLPD